MTRLSTRSSWIRSPARSFSVSFRRAAGCRRCREFAADAGVNPNTMQRAFAELERLELIRTQRTAGRTVTEDIARIEQEKRRLAQAGIDAFWQALAQLGYDRAQALELLRQDLQQAKED